MSEHDGMIVLAVSGPEAAKLFRHEPGGHRWQRVPPNERKGKVHSSTVTVAVMRAAPVVAWPFVRMADCEITTCRGSGPGGQHRNKTDSAVQVKHKPTGLIVRSESERSQSQNKAQALQLLESRLRALDDGATRATRDTKRRTQIGSGERSDKVRTVQMQNGQVIDHTTGRRCTVEKYLNGDLSWLG